MGSSIQFNSVNSLCLTIDSLSDNLRCHWLLQYKRRLIPGHWKQKRRVRNIVHTCMFQRTNTFRTPHWFLYASIADLIRQAKAHTTMHCRFFGTFLKQSFFFLVFNYLDSTQHKTGLWGFGWNFFHPSLYRMHALTNFNHNLAIGMPKLQKDWLAYNSILIKSTSTLL